MAKTKLGKITHITHWTCPFCGAENSTDGKDLYGTCRGCGSVHDWWQIDRQSEYQADHEIISQARMMI